MVVNGNRTFLNITGLSTYTEYQVSVVGVSSDGQPYKSYNVTAWTKEGGIVSHFYSISFNTDILRRGEGTKGNSFNIIIKSIVDLAKGRKGSLKTRLGA